MFQINSKPVKKKVVKGYRIYGMSIDRYVSAYNYYDKPRTGVWTKKVDDQFHAFTGRGEFTHYRKDFPDEKPRLYLVELRGNIQRGRWSANKKFPTYTADEMRIIKRVK